MSQYTRRDSLQSLVQVLKVCREVLCHDLLRSQHKAACGVVLHSRLGDWSSGHRILPCLQGLPCSLRLGPRHKHQAGPAQRLELLGATLSRLQGSQLIFVGMHIFARAAFQLVLHCR